MRRFFLNPRKVKVWDTGYAYTYRLYLLGWHTYTRLELIRENKDGSISRYKKNVKILTTEILLEFTKDRLLPRVRLERFDPSDWHSSCFSKVDVSAVVADRGRGYWTNFRIR